MWKNRKVDNKKGVEELGVGLRVKSLVSSNMCLNPRGVDSEGGNALREEGLEDDDTFGV